LEFVSYAEAWELLREMDVVEATRTEAELHLALGDPEATQIFIHCDGSRPAAPGGAQAPGVQTLQLEKAKIADALEHLLNKLHLQQVFLVPVGKWRKVFDAVAFSLASNEHWQEVDATASVALNTRDPLLCEPGDFHTVASLIRALFSDAESPDQGITITTPKMPFVIEIHPDGATRMSIGSAAVADEVMSTVGNRA
jgi:hypothetical protein